MCQVKESVEHVFMSCSKNELNRRTMMIALQRMCPVGNRVEDVLRCGDMVEGRKVVFSFLNNTGLMERV